MTCGVLKATTHTHRNTVSSLRILLLWQTQFARDWSHLSTVAPILRKLTVLIKLTILGGDAKPTPHYKHSSATMGVIPFGTATEFGTAAAQNTKKMSKKVLSYCGAS